MIIYLVDHSHGYGQAVRAFKHKGDAERYIQANLSQSEREAQDQNYSNGWGINKVELQP